MKNLCHKYIALIAVASVISVVLSILLIVINSISLNIRNGFACGNQNVYLYQSDKQHILSCDQHNEIIIKFKQFKSEPIIIKPYNQSRLVIDNVYVNTIFGNLNFKAGNLLTNLPELSRLSSVVYFDVIQGAKHSAYINSDKPSVLYSIIFSFFIVYTATVVLLILYNWLVFMIQFLANLSRGSARFEYIYISLLIIIVLFITLWNSYSGIVFQDEGFFLLMAKFPEDVKLALTRYYQFTHYLYLLSFERIYLFRLWTILIDFIVSLIFFKTLVSYIENKLFYITNTRNKILLFLVLFLSNFFMYLHHITPDYNSLCRVVTTLQVSTWIMIEVNKFKSKSNTVLLLILGFLVGINIFIKSPESILAIVTFTILIFIDKLTLQFRIKSILLMYFGFILGVTIYFIIFQDVHSFISQTKNSIYYDSLVGNHGLISLLLTNTRDFIYAIFWCLVIISIYALFRRYFLNNLLEYFISTSIIIFIIMLCNLVYLIHNEGSLNNYQSWVTSSFVILTSIVFLENYLYYRHINNELSNRSLRPKCNSNIIILLILFSYWGSIGTNISILAHMSNQLIFIVSLLIIQLIIFCSTKQYLSLVLKLLITIFSILIVNGLVYQSLRFSSLFKQTNSFEVNNHLILADKATSYNLAEFKKSLISCGYKEGDYIGGYYAIPEYVFAVGARSPITAWYNQSSDAISTLHANQFINRLAQINYQMPKFFLLDNNVEIKNLGFNDKIVLCGKFNFVNESQIYRSISVYKVDN